MFAVSPPTWCTLIHPSTSYSITLMTRMFHHPSSTHSSINTFLSRFDHLYLIMSINIEPYSRGNVNNDSCVLTAPKLIRVRSYCLTWGKKKKLERIQCTNVDAREVQGQQSSSMDVDDSESELDINHHTGGLLQRSIRIHREYDDGAWDPVTEIVDTVALEERLRASIARSWNLYE